MPAFDPRSLALLQAVGLCSCAASSGAPTTAAPTEPVQWVHAPIEIEPERQPLGAIDALVRSGRESLAAGHFKAAHASLRLATQKFIEQQDAALIAESLESAVATEKLGLDMLDAALGAGDLASARALIAEINEHWGESRRLQSSVVQLRELENGFGIAPCDANVDSNARPLRRAADAFAAWNELRSGLPADHAIPIPTDEQALLATLCDDGRCTSGEPKFVRLDGDNEATIALVVPHHDGSFSVLPDLLHTVDTGCGDQTALAFERHDGLVRVRAFGDRIENVDPDDWHFVELPEYAPTQAPAAAPSYAYAYASSGYQQGSSGSQPYGYAGYYGGYGCGDGDYDYAYNSSCQTHAHVERDLVLDLDRGEVVLDIVRTGSRGSALGRVTMASAPTGPVVDVQACGVSRSLQLSYT